MERVGRFEKVSFSQFLKDYKSFHGSLVNAPALRELWNGIKLPERATSGSAGYDFYSPFDLSFICPYDTQNGYVIPTGIRCSIEPGWLLALFPKSGLGFKHGVALRNTTGIIDSDYFFSDNEGHIMVKMTTQENCTIDKGKAFMQGIFLPFGITEDDNASGVRNGGFGSTGK